MKNRCRFISPFLVIFFSLYISSQIFAIGPAQRKIDLRYGTDFVCHSVPLGDGQWTARGSFKIGTFEVKVESGTSFVHTKLAPKTVARISPLEEFTTSALALNFCNRIKSHLAWSGVAFETGVYKPATSTHLTSYETFSLVPVLNSEGILLSIALDTISFEHLTIVDDNLKGLVLANYLYEFGQIDGKSLSTE